jgi:hypothetical protein
MRARLGKEISAFERVRCGTKLESATNRFSAKGQRRRLLLGPPIDYLVALARGRLRGRIARNHRRTDWGLHGIRATAFAGMNLAFPETLRIVYGCCGY